MTAKKGPAQQEPLLNTVARKLGHAAGTLTNVAQGLTGNLSALPEAVSTKIRGAATAGAPSPENRSARKKTRPAASRKRKSAAGGEKRNSAAGKSSGSRRKSTTSKTKKK